jgi:hypothetical protein
MLHISTLLVALTLLASIDDLLKQLDLQPSEIARSKSNASWGERIFDTYFSNFFDPKPFKRSYALIIGVSEFKGTQMDLSATRANPGRMRTLLFEQEGYDLVVTLENERATKERIEALMRDIFPDLVKSSKSEIGSCSTSPAMVCNGRSPESTLWATCR